MHTHTHKLKNFWSGSHTHHRKPKFVIGHGPATMKCNYNPRARRQHHQRRADDERRCASFACRQAHTPKQRQLHSWLLALLGSQVAVHDDAPPQPRGLASTTTHHPVHHHHQRSHVSAESRNGQTRRAAAGAHGTHAASPRSLSWPPQHTHSNTPTHTHPSMHALHACRAVSSLCCMRQRFCLPPTLLLPLGQSRTIATPTHRYTDKKKRDASNCVCVWRSCLCGVWYEWPQRTTAPQRALLPRMILRS
jgi:hypothetical protein